MEKAIPTVKGVAINPFELGLPESRLNLDSSRNWNNHHQHFSAKSFGTLALFQTFRDLERHQFLMPVDQHSELHRFYAPPVMPTVKEAMDVVVEAYEASERIRIGSALNPTFRPLGLDVLHRVTRDYNNQRAA